MPIVIAFEELCLHGRAVSHNSERAHDAVVRRVDTVNFLRRTALAQREPRKCTISIGVESVMPTIPKSESAGATTTTAVFPQWTPGAINMAGAQAPAADTLCHPSRCRSCAPSISLGSPPPSAFPRATHTPVHHMIAVVALLLCTGSCAPSRTARLPAAAPATERSLIRLTSKTCSLQSCHQTLAGGGEQLRVESRTRKMSAERARALSDSSHGRSSRI